VLRLQPFGEGNPEPVWGLRNVSVVGQPRIVGENHLKFSVAAGADVCEAIGFGMADRPVPEGPLDLAFSLDRDTYMGRNCLQFRLADFRPAGEEAGP
jgi:single-stranded-DNA-specific exonuclease